MRCALLPLLWLTACFEQLPPLETPAREVVPAGVPQPARSPRYGHVYVDVTDGPTRVRTGEPETRGCVSPCVLRLRVGRRALSFPLHGGTDQRDVDTIEVGPQPSVYRKSLGTYEPGLGRTLGLAGILAGSAGLVAGIVLSSVGLGVDSDVLAVAGEATLAAGLVVTAAGIVFTMAYPTKVREGPSIQYAW